MFGASALNQGICLSAVFILAVDRIGQRTYVALQAIEILLKRTKCHPVLNKPIGGSNIYLTDFYLNIS